MHSPFLYALFHDILQDPRHFYAFDDIAVLIDHCKKDKTLLPVTDFGAGSQVNNATERSVQTIAKSVKRPEWQYRWLFHLARSIRPAQILELGTSLGFSTVALAEGHLKGAVHTCEGAPAIHERAKQYFDQLGLPHIHLHTGPFAATLPQLTTTAGPFAFIILDGHHTEAATVQYFTQLLPHTAQKAVIWVDDIYWSPGMTRAWQTLTAHTRVSVSVDLYFFGLLFLDRPQEKQHIVLRHP